MSVTVYVCFILERLYLPNLFSYSTVTKFKHAPHSEIEKIHFLLFSPGGVYRLPSGMPGDRKGQKGIRVGSWQSLACTELYLIFWFPAMRQIEVREPLR